MAIRPWSDEYSSGNAHIDEQHKDLFRLINDFEEIQGRSIGADEAVSFLDDLQNLSREHFHDEEDMMFKSGYLLAEYHRDQHVMLLKRVLKAKVSIASGLLIDAYAAALDFSVRWLDHVVRDDVTFFSYYNNEEENRVKPEFVGRACEILTLDEAFLGHGQILSINGDGVIDMITDSKWDPQNLKVNDVVRVSTLSPHREWQSFLARVVSREPGAIKFDNSIMLKTLNDRGYYRVVVRLDAMLRSRGERHTDVQIIDISAGGAMIETGGELSSGDEAILEFVIRGTVYIEKCRIMRMLRRDSNRLRYGVMFTGIDSLTRDKLVKDILYLQIILRRGKDKRLWS